MTLNSIPPVGKRNPSVILAGTVFFLLLIFSPMVSPAQLETYNFRTSSAPSVALTKLNTASTKLIFAKGGNFGPTNISCMDGHGNVIWCKQMGNTTTRFASGAITAGDSGTFFIQGRNMTNGSGILCKMDSAGNVIWSRQNQTWNDIDFACLPSGRLMHTNGTQRIFIYDSFGNFLADRELPMITSVKDIVVRDSTSALYVGSGPNTNSSGGTSILLMAISDAGNVIWSRLYCTTGFSTAMSVVKTADGNFLVAGYQTDYGQGDKDIFLMKVDANGSVLWTKVYGTSGAENAYDLIELTDGSFLIAAHTSFGSPVDRRMLLMVDSAGAILRSMVYDQVSSLSNARVWRVVADSVAVYFMGQSTGYCYLQKAGFGLATGCDESPIALMTGTATFDPNNLLLSANVFNVPTVAITIPEVTSTQPFTVLCSGTCPQLINVTFNNTHMCTGDSLIGFPASVPYDSIKYFEQNNLLSSNDTLGPVLLYSGTHLIKTIRYYQGCTDSVVNQVTVDTLPLLSFGGSSRELLLQVVYTVSGVEGAYWTIDGIPASHEDTALFAFDRFGTYDICLIAGNLCRTDTLCQQFVLHDSVSYTYYRELYTDETLDWNGGHSVAPMHDGGAVFCGGVNNGASSCVYLHRVNADGSVKWDRFYNHSTSYDHFSVGTALETVDNGVLVAGRVIPSTQNAKAVIVRFDSLGNYSWQVAFTAATACGINDVVTTSDSGYVAVGFYAGDVAAIKINWLGQVEWFRRYDGYNYASAVTTSGDGGFVMTGQTFQSDMFLMKIDANGNWVWDQQFGGNGMDYGSDVVQANDSGYYIFGYTKMYQTNYSDLVLVKTDSLGNYQWTKRYWQVGRNQTPKDITKTDDGNLIVYGVGQGGITMSHEPLYIMRLDSVGNIIWSRTMDYPGYSVFTNYAPGELKLGENNKLYTTAGSTQNDKTIYAQMGLDAFTGCNNNMVYSVQPQVVNYDQATQFSVTQINMGYINLFYSLNNYTLQAFDSTGCYSNSCNPQLNVSYVTDGDTVLFSGMSTHNAQWIWYFGDGDSSLLQNPVHLYAFDGTYYVCSIIKTSCGTDSICQWVTVLTTSEPENSLPVFAASPNPVTDGFYFSADRTTGNLTLLIYTIDGRLLATDNNVNSGDFVALPDLANGMYFAEVYNQSDEQIGSFKFIK